MGRHIECVNRYFLHVMETGRARFGVRIASDGRALSEHVSPNSKSPIGYLSVGLSPAGNRANVEYLYGDARYSALQDWDIEFLADLEEIYDYYGLLNASGYPVSFSDFRLAACLTAIKYDGEGEINLPGGQSFSIVCK